MTIYEYITKNLSNLNWNILPQIFESEGVELTEDIEKYLRETPRNTNWNIFNSFKNGKVNKLVIYISDNYGQYGYFDAERTGMTPAQAIDYCSKNCKPNTGSSEVLYEIDNVEIRYSDESIFSQLGESYSENKSSWNFDNAQKDMFFQIYEDRADYEAYE